MFAYYDEERIIEMIMIKEFLLLYRYADFIHFIYLTSYNNPICDISAS
jgi:hypothetical protein